MPKNKYPGIFPDPEFQKWVKDSMPRLYVESLS